MLHCTSEMTRSSEGGALNARPLWERVPRIHCMAERRRENVSRVQSQDSVESH